jgi:hypothetical protein
MADVNAVTEEAPVKASVKAAKTITAEELLRQAAELLDRREGPRPKRYEAMAVELRSMADELERIQ